MELRQLTLASNFQKPVAFSFIYFIICKINKGYGSNWKTLNTSTAVFIKWWLHELRNCCVWIYLNVELFKWQAIGIIWDIREVSLCREIFWLLLVRKEPQWGVSAFLSVIRREHFIGVLCCSLQLPCRLCKELKLGKKTAVSYSSFLRVFLGPSVQVQMAARIGTEECLRVHFICTTLKIKIVDLSSILIPN